MQFKKLLANAPSPKSAVAVILLFFGLVAATFFVDPSEFREFKREAIRSINPATLQNWASLTLATNGDGSKIENKNLPQWVRRIGYPGNVEAWVYSHGAEKQLFLRWGGGFGSWGIISCPNHHFESAQDKAMQIVPWVSDLYFFRSKH